MILLDLFSGIGGFTKGFQDAGWKFDKHYYSDIDKYANAVYKHNFMEAIHVGDVRTIQGIERPNIITFGSPCQDFSLAGKRKGLVGERSGLVGAAITLIEKYRPDIFIWENVKGVFSSNDGADFWAVIQALTDIGGYRLEWQLLNTSWFLPQNRERIYLIGHLAGGSGQQVFPVEENERKDYKHKFREPKIKVGDFRYDEGIRIRKDGNSPTLASKQGVSISERLIIIYDDYNQKIKKDAVACTLTANCGSKAERNGQKLIIAEYGSKALNETLEKNISGDDDIVALDVYNKNARDISPTLLEPHNTLFLYEKSSIRRFTPIECERFQGFPDNWTQFGNFDGEVMEISDSQRYKMCGNAVTCKVVETIAKKLLI